MMTDLRTATVNAAHCSTLAHGSTLKVLVSLVVLATAGCSDMAPPAASANARPQSGLPASGPTLHAAPANVSQVAGLAAGADEVASSHVAVSSGDKTRVFLHGLHSPFGTALAMSRLPTPR